MADTPQIKCPQCKTSMSYTAAACPSCKRRMVAMPGNPNSGSGNVKTVGSGGLIGGLIAGATVITLAVICCASGNQSPEQQRMIQRQEEMRPVMNEMNRKMSEGKTKEEAAKEIIDDEIKRQEQRKK